jgi:hypothetical protein
MSKNLTTKSGSGGSAAGYKYPAERGDMPPNALILWRATDEGWVPEVPTHEGLIKHAEKFGTTLIAETAVELGYDLPRLTTLIARLDMIDGVHRNREKTNIKHTQLSRRSPEARAKKLLNWEPEPEEEAAA